MEYNFSSVTVEALEKIEKQLQKIKVALMDDVSNFIYILNNEKVNKTHGELCTTLHDLFNDEIKKSMISFTGCLNKVQGVLKQYVV